MTAGLDRSTHPASRLLGTLSLLLTCLAAALSAALEVLYVPSYLGGTIAPFTVLGGLVGNVLLALLGRAATGRTAGAALPIVCWLVVAIGLALTPRPEGDIIVVGGGSQQYVYYGVLLVGTIAGFSAAVVSSGVRPSGSVRYR